MAKAVVVRSMERHQIPLPQRSAFIFSGRNGGKEVLEMHAVVEAIAKGEDPTLLGAESARSDFLQDYLKKSELSEQLKRTERTLDRWDALGIGPPRTVIGRLILYRKSSVLEWLARQERRRPTRPRRGK